MGLPQGFVKAIAARKLPPGAVKEVKVQGKTLALANVDGALYAIEGHCPHAGGPLGEGHLRGMDLVCPLHFWAINLTTGTCPRAPTLALDRFELREHEGDLYVRLG